MISASFAVVAALFLRGSSAQTDKLHFVQEVVRHGARAPNDDYGFQVGPNELTASGMRQRFLLGVANRARYVD